MDIGGYDMRIVSNTIDPQEIAILIKNLICWKDAVEENASYQGCHLEDIFWYKDQASKEIWDKDIGPDNTMIHFMFDSPDQLHLVCDKEHYDLIKNYVKNSGHDMFVQERTK